MVDDSAEKAVTKGAKKIDFLVGHALVVAIANYPHVRPLPTAVLNDGTDLVAVLGAREYCAFDPLNVRELIDDQATLANLRTELDRLAAGTTSSDTVVLYFSGHGYRAADGTSALVPFDTDLNRMPETLLGEYELSEKLASIKARRMLVLIDACHAGGAGALKSTQPGEFGISEKSMARLAEGAGRVLIASSRATEKSHILPGAHNSLFTNHLLAALKGATPSSGDGVVRVFEVFNYVAEKVRANLADQHPIFKAADLEDNFPIALRRGGDKSVDLSPAVPSLQGLFADLYPSGPGDQDIWIRAGGDISRLKLQGTGRSNWFAALRTLELGGGGSNISRRSLIDAALDDYPHHLELRREVS